MKWDQHIDSPGVDALEFAAMTPLYEEALRRDAVDIGTISWLAHAYTRIGRISEGLELGTGVLEDRLYLRDLLVGDIEVVGVSEHVEESLEITAASHWAGHGAAPLTISRVGAVVRALGAEDACESNKGGYEDQRNQPISFHESLTFCRCLRRSRVERFNRPQC